MKPEDRLIEQSPLYQGANEKIAYKLLTTPWGGSPTDVTVVLRLLKDDSDVSATNMEAGAAIIEGDEIKTRRVISLAPHVGYRLVFKWMNDGNEEETHVEIYGQK